MLSSRTDTTHQLQTNEVQPGHGPIPNSMSIGSLPQKIAIHSTKEQVTFQPVHAGTLQVNYSNVQIVRPPPLVKSLPLTSVEHSIVCPIYSHHVPSTPHHLHHLLSHIPLLNQCPQCSYPVLTLFQQCLHQYSLSIPPPNTHYSLPLLPPHTQYVLSSPVMQLYTQYSLSSSAIPQPRTQYSPSSPAMPPRHTQCLLSSPEMPTPHTQGVILHPSASLSLIQSIWPSATMQHTNSSSLSQLQRPLVEIPFWVALLFGNVSRCKGKIVHGPDNKPLPPPDNLVLGHKEIVIFNNPKTGRFEQSSDKCNVYYHPWKTYVDPNFADFNPSCHLMVKRDVKSKLQPSHIQLLETELGIKLAI